MNTSDFKQLAREIKPYRDNVLVQKVLRFNVKSAIVMPDTVSLWAQQRTAEVLECGPACVDVKTGDVVILSPHTGYMAQWNSLTTMLIKEADITAVIEMENEDAKDRHVITTAR